MEFNGTEIDCIKRLAAMFVKGKTEWRKEEGLEVLGLNDENCFPTLRLLHTYNVIWIPPEVGGNDIDRFQFSANVIRESRDIARYEKAEQDGKDIVEHVKVTLRKHPVSGWAFVAISAITFVAIVITQIAGALKVLGISHTR